MMKNMIFGLQENMLVIPLNTLLMNFILMVILFLIIVYKFLFLLIGIRFDAATQIANDEFLKIIVQQSKEQARDR
jgi:type IV secretory pathway VirB3-like protein